MDNKKNLDNTSDIEYIFGALLLVGNKIGTLLERELKDVGTTTSQWFLSVMVDKYFDKDPTIKEVAKEMRSSHQNIKQVALKLQEKGLIKLYKDENDARITRLKLTNQSKQFWLEVEPRADMFTKSLFENINNKELNISRKVLEKILYNLAEMEEGKND